MSADVSCFDNIIGLTRTPCSDYTGLSTDYTTSDSGLWLDELIPVSKFESILNCKEGWNVWTFMEKARDSAIIDFRMDANAALMERSNLKRRPFKGRIGKVKRDSVLSLTAGHYYGIVIRCDDIVGGQILVSDVATMFNTTGVISLIVKDNLNTVHGTYALNTTANVLTANTIATLTLPMHSDYVENLEYYFYFLYAANTPYNNEFYDTCGSYCLSNASQTNKQFGYNKYSSVAGVNLTSVTDLSDVNISSDSRCFGLSLGLLMRCVADDIWCYDEMDYIGDVIDMSVAKAVRLKAALNLIRDIALSENLNFETVIDGATLGVMQEEWVTEYTDTIDFIVKNIDIEKVDCFECGKEILAGVRPILN